MNVCTTLVPGVAWPDFKPAPRIRHPPVQQVFEKRYAPPPPIEGKRRRTVKAECKAHDIRMWLLDNPGKTAFEAARSLRMNHKFVSASMRRQAAFGLMFFTVKESEATHRKARHYYVKTHDSNSLGQG